MDSSLVCTEFTYWYLGPFCVLLILHINLKIEEHCIYRPIELDSLGEAKMM